jgi:hypothetical protein
MFNQKSKAMPTLAYVMNSRTCKTLLEQSATSDQAKMIYDVLNCYYDYYEATEKAKEELMKNLQEIANRPI